MGTLVERVRSERFAVDELFTRRNDNLIPGRGVVGFITLHLINRAEEEIVINHLVYGRVALQVSLMLDLTGSHLLQLLVQFRSRLGDVRLTCDIEHLNTLKTWSFG